MTTRILPREEWPRLNGTEAEKIWPQLNPAHGHFVVIEDGDEIVGCCLFVSVLHCECLWIHPAHRGKGSVARRLWAAIQATGRRLGARAVMGGARSREMHRLMAHVKAEPIHAAHYMVPIRQE